MTDGDWKKLWMEAGNINPNSKTDNTIDSSDSPIFEDTEVSEHIYFGHILLMTGNSRFLGGKNRRKLDCIASI